MKYLVLLLVLLGTTVCHALPDPKTGGKAGAPVSVLVVTGMGGVREFSLDAGVAKDLADKGYLVRQADDREPLTADYLRQFNAVIVVGLRDFNGGGYYGVGGISLLNTAKNVTLIQQYVQDGGGLLFVPVMAGAGSQVADTYNEALAPWKLRVGWETVRDDANQFKTAGLDNYFWTRNIAAHPTTAGVKALAYPGQLMRWDDAYPSNPLFLDDPAWTAVARGEATSRGVRNVSYKWMPADAGAAPVLAVVRQAGKGRVAVVGLGGFYLITHAFFHEIDPKTNKPVPNLGEATTGLLDGIAYRKGDGQTASDWGLFLDNTLRWMAEASTAAGMGGAPAAWQTKLARVEVPADPIPDFAVVNWATAAPPPTWAHHLPNFRWWRGMPFYDEELDPLATHPQRQCRLLIGAHSAYSDGAGTVAEWAKAAKAAGYQAVIFTERFENLDGNKWAQFIAECKANSSPEFACLQGMDIGDTYGNRFLILGNNNFPTGGMLTKDGKGLEMTARLSLGFSGHIAVVHRMGGNATLPKELIRHFQGISVYTYAPGKDGKYGLADDAFDAYKWQLFNASNPVPIAVHELYSPARIADAAIGFQQIVPAQDAQDAVRYFRYGMDHFFENPERYYITEGPQITGWSIFNKDIGICDLNRDHFRAVVGAASGDDKSTITEAVLYDRGKIARRWTPNAPAFTQTIEGEHGYQRYYLLVVTDSQGRRAISPHLRTVERGYYTRCGDRQNWFGAAGSYTGIWPSGTHGIWYINPDVPAGDETETFGGGRGNPLASKMSLPFASNALTFTDFTIDCKYISPVQYGMDAWRIENAIPTTTYTAYARVGKWHDVETGLTTFNTQVKTLTRMAATLTLKKALPATTGVFPAIQNVQWQTATYVYTQDGQKVEGKLDGKATTLIDLPAGAHIADYFLLAPLTVSGNGRLGWRAEVGKDVPAGATFTAAWLYLPREWRAELGADGATPWSLKLTQGTAGALGVVTLAAKNYGVAGTLTAGGTLKNLPLAITGLNGNWPAALWTADGIAYQAWSGLAKPQAMGAATTAGPPYLAHIGVCDGVGYAALPNVSGRFYVGNTLTATNPALVLNYALWTKDRAVIEVNNPTDAPITAKLASAPIPGKRAVKKSVTVPAGASLTLDVK